jgi:hypothetical protein
MFLCFFLLINNRSGPLGLQGFIRQLNFLQSALILWPFVENCLLILLLSRSQQHNETPQFVGLLMRDHLIADTPTGQHTTLSTYKHPCTG